jgi:hypothetical protein
MPEANIYGGDGGFFYSPFHQCTALAQLTFFCGVGVYSGWHHAVAPGSSLIPHRTRFIHIDISSQGAGVGVYYVQLGLGPVGSEVLWQPSDGNGFYLDLSLAGVLNSWKSPYSFDFPVGLGPNQEISARGMLFVGPPLQTLVVKVIAYN